MTEDEFEEKYRPKQNHLEDAAFNGWMYETYGPEFEHVQAQDHKVVWTYVDTDGDGAIVPGFAWVNRLGYILTEVPWETGEEEVILEGVNE